MADLTLPRFDHDTLLRHRRRNAVGTAALLATVVALLAWLGWLVAGTAGMVMLALVSGFYLGAMPNAHPGLLLRWLRARPVAADAGLSLAVARLAQRAELEATPAVFLIPSEDLNAMALGTRQPVVAVTHGLLQLLDDRELVGVLAHEISHLAHGDLRLLAMFDAAARLTQNLFWVGIVSALFGMPWFVRADGSVRWLALTVLASAPTLVLLLRLALSRMREFGADLGAVRLTGDPLGLASALTRLERYHDRLRRFYRWTHRQPADAAEPTPEWLRTHPVTRARVARLLELHEPAAA